MEVRDYDRFRVDDGAEVLALLRRSAQTRALCSVRAAGRPETYLSPLRELAGDGDPVLDPPRAPVIERALTPGSLAAIDLRLPECRVSFETRVARVARGGGRPLLQLERPAALVKLQKRETFRVQLPEGAEVRVTLDASEPGLTAVPMHDLSVQGGSLSLTGVRGLFEVGQVFDGGRLSLPDGSAWPVSLRVVHAGVLRRQSDGGEVRVGVQFVQADDAFESAVARVVSAIARGSGGAPRA